MKKESGIYAILNNVNNKIYIGSSIDIKRRFREHKRELNNNKHHNPYLQDSWSKYGELNFSFIILENSVSRESLIYREMFWIKLKDSLVNTNGYNLAIPSNTQMFTYSDEIKLKIGYNTYKRKNIDATEQDYLQIKIEKDLKKSNQKKRNPEDLIVYQIDKTNSQFIAEYASSGTAAKNLNLNKKRVQDVLRGIKPSHKGFIFVYKKNYNPNTQYIVVENQKHIKTRKPLYKYDLQMNLIKEWATIQEAILELGYSKSSLETAVCKNMTYKGFYWRRKLI